MTVNPPFRADIVGSFLRSPSLKDARTRHEAGSLSDAGLREVEDAEIVRVVARQADAGLKLATDGEFRRSWWHFDFFDGLQGVEIVELDHGIQFQGVQTRSRGVRVTGPIRFPADHPMIEHYRFLQSTTAVLPKMTIPAPTVLHFRLESGAVNPAAYDDAEDTFDDLARAYRDAIAAFYDAGCRYLQFDDTAWAYLCSDVEIAKAAERGIRTDGLAERYALLINASLAGKPDDMTVTTHVCRGNFRSTWISSGGYEPVAEQLLSVCNYDGYFLEYDSERAGTFAPLRHLPAGDKVVVLGLVTTKSGELEDRELLKRRIAEAATFVPLEQLALSPQCGFASTEDGNDLSEEQQWAKVREVVEVAADVWH
ncbi:5-methyltetrahydropteroyltriglutamate--homocysteine methyltransferase [Cryobacterium psychrotolerans]|uniref:5-methyltetrahydropteroyltriglutamate--homocysteine methyltransferase n=1 Tax=Cryobacterium psychrotolerans TaxID=386301 RepID=A0A1G9B4W7_9MICO|nr:MULTISPECIES: 5-methyltetrahydropteroyltriglutamate--homocysteine S-methyltransferase [Cryobacterium]TFD46272.1 5-methyltetrahydropteroyltriglutamate--homocysteine S-methyltransferase [Cryobacterium sp. TMT1-2-1]TFD84632.1 5-methyltetrahydropteroyltriglutamate--homocysteine S-methyltransferase [Cryobacterium psychrotolerans]SDK34606.1 5-methyltetrahydropteroyltriglutamate--homocysteine methyltransferase [Cryobacterium psychrotolerans]